jgi:hypothetical protein
VVSWGKVGEEAVVSKGGKRGQWGEKVGEE